MRTVFIKENEAGQRLDKYLRKFLKEAPGSFLYKMLRKKNITWNGKKASGSEKLEAGDEVRFFLSEETLIRFGGGPEPDPDAWNPGLGESGKNEILPAAADSEYAQAFHKYGELETIYEDRHILLVNKPVGILTQKAKREDLSLNEWVIGYLLSKGELTKEELRTFKPSVCNRLDRNTSGIVLCGKTLKGSQELSRLLKDRSLHKYYLAYVKGQVKEASYLKGVLLKDEVTNRVTVTKKEHGADSGGADSRGTDGSYIQTRYEPLRTGRDRTLLKVELITGKTHQIRAHLSSTGHPVIGDYKYGDRGVNDRYKKKYGIKSQLLHAWIITFPVMEGEPGNLSGRTFTAAPPEIFRTLEAERPQNDITSQPEIKGKPKHQDI